MTALVVFTRMTRTWRTIGFLRNLLLATACFIASPVFAGISGVALEVQDETVSLGSSATEIVLHLTGPIAQRLAAYNIALSVIPSGGELLMTGGTMTLNHPPVFPGQLPYVPVTGESLLAADNAASGGADLVDGLGLIRILLSVDPAAVGQQFDIVFDPKSTFLFDEAGAPIQIVELNGGHISVVPEMGTLTLTGMSVLAGGLARLRRASSNRSRSLQSK